MVPGAGGCWRGDVNVGVSNEELAANEPDFLTLAFGITGASAPQTTAARTEMQLQDINNAFKNNPAINICRLKMASPQKPRWGQGGTACTSHAGAHSCSVSQRSTERGSAHGQRSLPQLCTAPRAPGRHRCSVRGQTAPGGKWGKSPEAPTNEAPKPPARSGAGCYRGAARQPCCSQARPDDGSSEQPRLQL